MLSTLLFVVAGISFFVGGRILHEARNVDRTLAEVLGIGFAVLCAFAGTMSRRAIEDLDWEEANEKALSEDRRKS